MVMRLKGKRGLRFSMTLWLAGWAPGPGRHLIAAGAELELVVDQGRLDSRGFNHYDSPDPVKVDRDCRGGRVFRLRRSRFDRLGVGTPTRLRLDENAVLRALSFRAAGAARRSHCQQPWAVDRGWA